MSKTNKFILWCAMVAVTSFWMWASAHAWLQGSLFSVENELGLVSLSALFVVLLVLLSLGLVFFRSHLWTLYLGLIAGGTFLAVFGISNLNLVGVFILVMLFYHAQEIVHGEMSERLKMNSRILIKKGLANFVVGFFVLTSFAAYQSPAIENFKNLNSLPSTTQVFFRSIVVGVVNEKFQEVPEDQREQAINQLTVEGITRANTFLQPYFEYIPPALAFGLFLLLWSIGWVFIWLSVFLGMGIFWVLKKISFFKLESFDVKAEKIVM